MKNHRLRPLALWACAFLVALPAAAAGAVELKIATVDLEQVFTNYYKTKLADASIKEEASGLEKERKTYIEEHQNALSDYKKALDEANNQAVSSDEREKRKKEAEGKLIKVNDLRQQIDQFDRTARGRLDENLRRTRDKILTSIRAVITEQAKTMGYGLVLDSSTPDTGGRPPVVLFTNGSNDITAPILQKLNADAPTDFPDKERKGDKRDEKKDEKKDGKK